MRDDGGGASAFWLLWTGTLVNHLVQETAVNVGIDVSASVGPDLVERPRLPLAALGPRRLHDRAPAGIDRAVSASIRTMEPLP